MERFMRREGVTAEHGSSSSESPLLQRRSSEGDVDFGDVFGGPPRRFSMQEVRVRYSFGEEGEAATSSSSSKPVFGEERRRRRQGGDDFFDDIFRGGDESSVGSPRTGGSLFGSNSGGSSSRIMSPVGPPKAEHFGTSPPALLSLPAKLSKAMELPTFGSRNQSQYKMDGSTNELKSPNSSSSLSRFSNQATRGQDELRNEVYSQSPFSRQASFRSPKSPSTVVSNREEDIQNSKKDMGNVDSFGDQFHFSIYKWANGGVPLLIPEPLKMESEKKVTMQNLKEERVKSRDVKIEKKEVALKKEETSEPEVKPFLAFLNDEVDQRGNVTKTKENKTRTPKSVSSNKRVGKNAKKTEEKSFDSDNASIDSGPASSKSGVKGKVRDFVQIFNVDADSKPKADIQMRSPSFRWPKGVGVNREESEVSLNAAKVKEKVKLQNFDKKPDVSLKVDEDENKDEAQHSHTKNPNHGSDCFYASQKNAFSSESLQRDSKISVDNSDNLSEASFLFEELSEDHEEVTQSEGSEDIKALDAKIEQWSVGKEGNIRSLLSTLHYVLWPGSGWKAVPLVDLIEANSVKRAYQKALLRIHPDKLQQKGADFDHKYIAEKVFDIVQEAWDHFNTLAPL